jgi:hypothetical protein
VTSVNINEKDSAAREECESTFPFNTRSEDCKQLWQTDSTT